MLALASRCAGMTADALSVVYYETVLADGLMELMVNEKQNLKLRIE